jgi:hypothetical protein
MKRPFGVYILAFAWALGGTVYVLQGLQLTTAVTFGHMPAGTGEWFWGWVIILTGILFWAAAGAALSLQVWAWQLGMFLALWGLFQAAIIIIGVGTLEHALIATGFPVFLLWYLNREPVRKAFGVDEGGDAAAA